MRKALFPFLLLVCIATTSYAQQYVTSGDFDRISKVTAGPSLNMYFGELRRLRDPKLQAGLGFTIGYEHLMTDKLGLRTNLSIYKIQADDSLSRIPANQERNLNFKATNFEFIVQGQYYMFRHPHTGYKDRAFMNPYIHLGVGVTTNNPRAELGGIDYDLRPLSLEGEQYGGLAMVVPLGVGFDIFVARNFDFQLDFQYTIAMTGYLDDVNGVYRDQSSFTDTNGVNAATMALLSDPRTALNPPLPAVDAGTARGDGSNDSYFRVGFKLAYYLPKSLYGKSSIRCRVTKKTR
jgi:hypothetical protein